MLLMMAAAEGQPADAWALAERAVRASPALEGLQARAASLHHRARVAGAWSDPVLSVELSNAPVTSLSLGDHPMSGTQLRLQQHLPPPGRSRLLRSVGEGRAEVADEATAEAALRLRAHVVRSWWELTRIRGLRRLTDAHLARSEELLASVRVRFETGGVGQYAVVRLEVLRDRLRDDLGDFERADTELVSALTAALASDEETFETPAEIPALPPPPPQAWTEVARAHRPALRRWTHERRAAEQGARLARVDAFRGVTLWAGYRVRTIDTPQDAGVDFASLGVGVPLPLSSVRRSRGEREAALSEAVSASAHEQALLDAVDADMQAILARWRRASDKVALYDDTLIPSATAALQLARADFAVGRADFASVFDTEVELVDLERSRLQAAVQTHLQQAEALAVLGVRPTTSTLGEAP